MIQFIMKLVKKIRSLEVYAKYFLRAYLRNAKNPLENREGLKKKKMKTRKNRVKYQKTLKVSKPDGFSYANIGRLGETSLH